MSRRDEPAFPVDPREIDISLPGDRPYTGLTCFEFTVIEMAKARRAGYSEDSAEAISGSAVLDAGVVWDHLDRCGE